MKRTQVYFFAIAVMAAVAISISSCKKEEVKDQAPVIVIDEPTDNAITMLPDSTHIKGTASDADELHELSIVIKSHMGDTVFAKYPTVHEMPSYTFNYHFATNDTGMYHLHVSAVDHDGGLTSKEVKFYVK